MYRREDFIKFIPKPKNEDVIVYNIDLKDLIDIDVEYEYNSLYPVFINKKNEYLELKKELAAYEESINNIYLYNNSWKEQDYLLALQNDKKIYSTLFGEIKRKESSIEVIKKKIENINERIDIQRAKEQKENQNKADGIDKDIEKSKEQLEKFKDTLKIYQDNLDKINEDIKDNEEDFLLLQEMGNQLDLGEYKCVYCGSLVKVRSESSRLHQRLIKNIENNKLQLEKLLKNKEKAQLNVVYYENEIKKIKNNLQNDISFKKNQKNFYIKKSTDVLKLEALRDELYKNMNKQQKELDSIILRQPGDFKGVKKRIELYEVSLNNLNKIKELREIFSKKIELFKEIEKKLKETSSKLKKYLEFLNIFYKIYEQKATEYCGHDYKFKFFLIDEYEIKKVFYIYYRNVEYSELDKVIQEEVDKVLINKFAIYF